jgi:hypothetical protein
MLDLQPSFKKSRPDVTEEESDIDAAFLKRHSDNLDAKEADKNAKALVKLNEKLKEEGKAELVSLPDAPKLKPGELFEREKEKIEAMSLERLEKKLVSLSDRIQSQKTMLVDKV